MTIKHPTGRFPFGWGKYETAHLLAWLAPVLLTGGLTWATKYVAVLSEAGGWRAVLAGVLAMAGRTVYVWLSDNSGSKL